MKRTIHTPSRSQLTMGIYFYGLIDTILVVVDIFSKMAILIPCKKTMATQQIAQLFFEHVWKHYGLTTTIISDRNAIFVSTFWKTPQQHLDTRLSLSTTFHPQTERQMEVVNHLLVQLLCMYNHTHHRPWDDSLPYIHHSYNHAQQSSIGKSPFEICYEFQPSAPIDLISSSTHSNDTEFEGREVEKALKFRDQIYNIEKQAQEMLQ